MEKWPDQPKTGVIRADMGLFEVPPWFRGRSIKLKYASILIKTPSALAVYRRNPECLDELVAQGIAKILPPGRDITALENIYTWSGLAHDGEYGDGYVLMTASF